MGTVQTFQYMPHNIITQHTDKNFISGRTDIINAFQECVHNIYNITLRPVKVKVPGVINRFQLPSKPTQYAIGDFQVRIMGIHVTYVTHPPLRRLMIIIITQLVPFVRGHCTYPPQQAHELLVAKHFLRGFLHF